MICETQPECSAKANDVHGDVATSENSVFRITSTRSERKAAFRIIYDAYLRSNLCDANRFGMRVTPYHLLPSTEVFVAISDWEVMGTLTLARDGELGLPMEDVFTTEVKLRRARGLRLAEACSLASRCAEGSAKRLYHVLELYRLMAQCARFHDVDQILAAVQPRHLRAYQRFMAFDIIGEVHRYPACDCEAVPICLDLKAIERNPPKNYRRFFGEAIPEEQLHSNPISWEDQEYFRAIVEETWSYRGQVFYSRGLPMCAAG